MPSAADAVALNLTSSEIMIQNISMCIITVTTAAMTTITSITVISIFTTCDLVATSIQGGTSCFSSSPRDWNLATATSCFQACTESVLATRSMEQVAVRPRMTEGSLSSSKGSVIRI